MEDAFQGEPGAYSEAAAIQLFSGALGEAATSCFRFQGLHSFSDVFDAVQKGSAMYGMIPVENTIGGSIHANYDLMLRCSDLHVVAELDFHVKHCLIGPPGTTRNDIRLVMSHWQALAQCDGYLRAWGVQTKVAFDTAGSAKMVKEQGLKDTAAIASELAASTYGLEVLARNIQDIQFNHTRFLLLSREPCSVPRDPGKADSNVKTTVIFWAPHIPGALFKCVSTFALRDIGIIKTESRPVPPQHWKELEQLLPESSDPGSKAKYNYIFYVDVSAHAESEAMKNALDHLRELTPFVRTLGPYPTGGTLTLDVALRTRAVMPPPAAILQEKKDGMKIGIFGFGKFGQYLSRRLLEHHQVYVTSIEPELSPSATEMGCVWVPWSQAAQDMLLSYRVEVLVIATSMLAFEETVSRLPAAVLQQTKPLVVDVLSVKSYPKQVLLTHIPQECDILCSHPMFGPESGRNGWHGLPFVFDIVRTSNWDRTQQFLSIFELGGCRMVSMTSEEHDKQTAASQFITHLTGRVLAEHGVEPTPIDTVGYQNLCLIAEHVCKDSFDLFYGLFKYNPNSMQQLCLFKRGIADVERQLQQRCKVESTGEASTSSTSALSLSSMIGRISESKTAQIQALSKQMQDEGQKVNGALCVGEPGYAPPPEVLAALKEAPLNGHTKYTVVQGDIELRRAICEDLRQRKGVEYTPEQILVSCGGKQAIYQALLAVCDEGDEVLVPTPCWVSYHDIARLCRATPVPVETLASDGYVLRAGSLAAALEASGPLCKVVVLCNPSNPTGALIPAAELNEIAEVLRRPEFSHVYVLADEIYERIVYDADHVCFAALPGMKRRTLLINGFSKGYAMTGLRLGYLAAAHDGVAAAALKLQGQITSCASSVVQRAALAALRGGASVEDWLQARLKELRQKRDLIVSHLRKLPGIDCPTPEGAFYVFPDLSKLFARHGAKVKSSEEFCCVLLREHKVALVPGEAFHAPNTVRFSYACNMEDLEAALDAFAACVAQISN